MEQKSSKLDISASAALEEFPNDTAELFQAPECENGDKTYRQLNGNIKKPSNEATTSAITRSNLATGQNLVGGSGDARDGRISSRVPTSRNTFGSISIAAIIFVACSAHFDSNQILGVRDGLTVKSRKLELLAYGYLRISRLWEFPNDTAELFQAPECENGGNTVPATGRQRIEFGDRTLVGSAQDARERRIYSSPPASRNTFGNISIAGIIFVACSARFDSDQLASKESTSRILGVRDRLTVKSMSQIGQRPKPFFFGSPNPIDMFQSVSQRILTSRRPILADSPNLAGPRVYNSFNFAANENLSCQKFPPDELSVFPRGIKKQIFSDLLVTVVANWWYLSASAALRNSRTIALPNFSKRRSVKTETKPYRQLDGNVFIINSYIRVCLLPHTKKPSNEATSSAVTSSNLAAGQNLVGSSGDAQDCRISSHAPASRNTFGNISVADIIFLARSARFEASKKPSSRILGVRDRFTENWVGEPNKDPGSHPQNSQIIQISVEKSFKYIFRRVTVGSDPVGTDSRANDYLMRA
ncbi:hypothetical protein DFH09DRAFT_1070642 [Mycena vulgaris]|nr:hypothetical protein DFH09DRAFT_1070642 [Mycena vulgaris]